MRIRFFNTFEPVSPFYRDLLPELAEQGFDVEVIVSKSRYRASQPRLKTTLSHPNICVREIPTGIDVLSAGWQKGWVMLTYMIGAMWLSLFGRKTDLNFFLTQPPLFALWGVGLRALRGQPFHCMIMDLYPDVAVQSGMLPREGIGTRILTWLSRFPLRRAEAVVVIGRCMRDKLSAEGIPAERIHVIHNWISADEVYAVPHDKNKLRRELGFSDEFIILYSGNLGVSHWFDDIIAAAIALKDKSDILFVFIGEGSRKSEVEAAIVEHNLQNVRLLPYQSIECLPESLSLGDVHFVCLRDGFEGCVVPSKAYSSLGVGRAMLYQGRAFGEIARMVEEERIGIVVAPYHPEQLRDAILTLYTDRAELDKMGRRASGLNNGQYKGTVALQQYISLFQNRTQPKKDDSMKRTPLRYLWSHEHWLHRSLIKVYNRLMQFVPFGLKYAVGLRGRQNGLPYRLIEPGNVIVQVGAPHDTLSSGRSRAYYFSLLAGEAGRVVAVEPDEKSVNALRETAIRQGQNNLLVHHSAAWSEKTTIRIYVDDSHPASNFTEGTKGYDAERLQDYRVIELAADSLDNILEQHAIQGVDLVSITTNGAERAILDGLRATMARGLPYICLARTGEGYIEMMESFGYALYDHDDRGFTFQQVEREVGIDRQMSEVQTA